MLRPHRVKVPDTFGGCGDSGDIILISSHAQGSLTYMKDVQYVVEQVKAAFADVATPPRESLINNHCCECLETSEAFGGKAWQDITLENLLAGRETALLTSAAWRYYLPAVITWCVRAPEAVDVIQDNLVYQLAPPATETEWAREWFEPRASGFSQEQRKAITAYLEWYRDREAAEWATLGTEPPGHVYRALEFWSR